MPTNQEVAETKRVKKWQKRSHEADKVYEDWEKEFEVDKLEDYYLGHHWDQDQLDNAGRYVINLCFAAVESQIPTMIFLYPSMTVQPKPTKADDLNSNLELRARLYEDIGNDFIHEDELGFFDEARLAVQESFYRFGVLEVGYTGDYIDNPDAGKPILKENGEPLEDDKGEIPQPDKVASAESVYFKRIPASQFRVSVRAHNDLRRCDWAGYYEWWYKEDIKRHPGMEGRESKMSGFTGYKGKYDQNDKDDDSKHRGMVKVWFIWDLRLKVRHIFPETGEVFIVENEKFDYLPFHVLKFHERMDEFYPLPPMFNWLSPQRELDETREMQKIHRKRFYRRYKYLDGRIEKEELRKLETGGDGVMIAVQTMDSIMPLEDAPLDAAVARNLPTSKDDFMRVSGVSGESQGVPQADTATQAAIIDSGEKVRDNFARSLVSKWLGKVCRTLLLTIRDNMTLPVWVKTNVDQSAQNQQLEMLKAIATYKEITISKAMPEDFNFDVTVDIESKSPANSDTKRNNWNQVLAFFSNPTLMSVLSASPELLTKTLAQYDIKSEREIQQIQQAFQQVLQQLSSTPPGAPPSKLTSAGGVAAPNANAGAESLMGADLAAPTH